MYTGRREQGEPVASLTLFRDAQGEAGGVDVVDVKAALRALFPESTFRVEQRGLVVEGRSQVVFEVYDRAAPSATRLTDNPPEGTNGSSGR